MENTIKMDCGVEIFIKDNLDSFLGACTNPYMRVFDTRYSPWKDSRPEYNLMYLRLQQAYANDLLMLHGYLYLNDVYEMLGLSKVEKLEYVGWRYNENNPTGDNYVSFGIYELYNRDFINGASMKLLLNFNVDGYIGKRNK